MTYKNKEYRRKLMKGAKVDDLYLYLDNMKEFADKKTVEHIQRFIEKEFGYEPVTKNIANG